MLGHHCLRTWSSTQGAIALSSAEAEFYALIEAVLRGRGMFNLLSEVGLHRKSPVIRVFIDSSAAKSFVSKRGLGKMRHLELRDLWLQREVGEGKVVIGKVTGERILAGLMTKFLSTNEIGDRLGHLNVQLDWAVLGQANAIAC